MVHELRCEWCGGTMKASRRHARFCSDAHRQAAYRAGRRYNRTIRLTAKQRQFLERFPVERDPATGRRYPLARSAVREFNMRTIGSLVTAGLVEERDVGVWDLTSAGEVLLRATVPEWALQADRAEALSS